MIKKAKPQTNEAGILTKPEKLPEHTRNLTLKLDPIRYQRLNRAKYELTMSGQDILVEALDLWMAKHKY